MCSIGKHIQKARLAAHMTRAELARRSGYNDPSSIWRIENNLALPRNIQEIAHALLSDESTPRTQLNWSEQRMERLITHLVNAEGPESLEECITLAQEWRKQGEDAIIEAMRYLRRKRRHVLNAKTKEVMP